ncbi:DUF5819 family protein [Streptomyces sp. NPDC001985]|uniref:DUF5819 family protein n=1 Tax=Streptomyces sp. NPDC001985 TaxID=3154406 RepID=UPI00332579FF
MGSAENDGAGRARERDPGPGPAGPARTVPHPPEQRRPQRSSAPAPPPGPSVPPPDPPASAAADPDPPASAADPDPPAPAPGPPAAGILALSPPYRVAAALCLALVAAVAGVHLAMVFLHVAPANTVTKRYGETVNDWIYPEFEQSWKLFAPNPLQQNVSVQVKAEIRRADGGRETTGWINLTAEDAREVRGNPLPSHVQQNQLRRGWDILVNSHDAQGRPHGLRGRLSEGYVRRIAMHRLDAHDLGGAVERIRLRSSTRTVKAPPWSEEKTDTRPVHRVLPWWTVTGDDLPLGVRNDRGRPAGAAR